MSTHYSTTVDPSDQAGYLVTKLPSREERFYYNLFNYKMVELDVWSEGSICAARLIAAQCKEK